MTHKIKISIPEPCHENWFEMSPTEKGRFCSSCQKNVIDFTKSSDREIVMAYNENEKLCGRFNNFQINRNLIIPKEKKSIWVITAASIITFLGLGTQHAKAQGKIKIEQTEKPLNDSIKSDSRKKLKNYEGILYDSYNFPLSGANVVIKGTSIETQTNINGEFSIEAKKGDILVFHYLDSEDKEFRLTKNLKIIVKMKAESTIASKIRATTGAIRVERLK